MVNFIIRRLGEAVLVMLGVLLLTFVLFQMAAGDPAAAVLGKNPKPQEIENLRRELKSDLPLFYGHWRKSEVYTACDYQEKFVELPGIEVADTRVKTDTGVKAEKFVFKRKFAVPEKVLAVVSGTGGLRANNKEYYVSGQNDVILEKAPSEIVFHNQLNKVEFFRWQDNAFNSQFINSLRELVDVKSTFPYVSFLNFGKTITTREPINNIIARGIIPSLSVMLPVFILELVLGIILAMIATACKDTLIDRGLLVLSVAGMSISYLVLILAGQWYLGYYCNLFPVWGWGGVRYLALPVLPVPQVRMVLTVLMVTLLLRALITLPLRTRRPLSSRLLLLLALLFLVRWMKAIILSCPVSWLTALTPSSMRMWKAI